MVSAIRLVPRPILQQVRYLSQTTQKMKTLRADLVCFSKRSDESLKKTVLWAVGGIGVPLVLSKVGISIFDHPVWLMSGCCFWNMNEQFNQGLIDLDRSNQIKDKLKILEYKRLNSIEAPSPHCSSGKSDLSSH